MFSTSLLFDAITRFELLLMLWVVGVVGCEVDRLVVDGEKGTLQYLRDGCCRARPRVRLAAASSFAVGCFGWPVCFGGSFVVALVSCLLL